MEMALSMTPVRKRIHSFFECFPYVCPEPVLVKRSFLPEMAQNGVFLPASCIAGTGSIPETAALLLKSFPMSVSRACLLGFQCKKWTKSAVFSPSCSTPSVIVRRQMKIAVGMSLPRTTRSSAE
jgi:hypothetical protein